MFRDFYNCPELIAGKQYFDPNTAIYSLNLKFIEVVLYILPYNSVKLVYLFHF